MTFRLVTKKVHLTYAKHINGGDLIQHIQLRTNRRVKHYSIVTETGDTGHDHTHALLWFDRQIDTRNPRLFDYQGDHPNIKRVDNDVQWTNTWTYHEKDPIDQWLSGEEPVAAEKGKQPIVERIKRAKTLAEACAEAGVEIKSVSDVNMIRNDKPRVEGTTTCYDRFNRDQEQDFKVLIVWGKSGTGKTEWALSHFANALMVSHMDTLRSFDPLIHDGIVFDDMSFGHMPREAAIHLLDWNHDRDIHARYSPARIPKHTRKIFTTNVDNGNIFPADFSGAIQRRICKTIHVMGRLWNADDNVPQNDRTEVQAMVAYLREEEDQLEAEAVVDHDLACHELFASQTEKRITDLMSGESSPMSRSPVHDREPAIYPVEIPDTPPPSPDFFY